MSDAQLGGETGSSAAHSLETTATLLTRARAGDNTARDQLITRYLPALRRWAHGRLPLGARSMLDTDDLVQITLIRALNKLGEFEPRHDGAFLAYLHQILLNQIRDELRRARRRPERGELDEGILDQGPSPLEQAMGRDALERYEQALASLPGDQREAVVLRVEYGFDYGEMAQALERPTPNAARMLLARALVALARRMHERK